MGPRSRGEHSDVAIGRTTWWDSPPLARGARWYGVRAAVCDGLTPARAGSTTHTATLCNADGTHPRSRGEHLPHFGRMVPIRDSPPLARGALVLGQLLGGVEGLTPARAESTTPMENGKADELDSPPLARGAQLGQQVHGVGVGLTPARAGSTSASCARPTATRTHPRSRGEHGYPMITDPTIVDSPPLARGAHTRTGPWFCTTGLTPARAGSTHCWASTITPRRTHPRSRGEHEGNVGLTAGFRDSPPLARGARHPVHPRRQGLGLTPARAGSTPRCSWPREPRRTHPRSRGEHSQPYRKLPACLDSPPLARGSTTSSGSAATPDWTHPRSRGEHSLLVEAIVRNLDSPPLARGAHPLPYL